MGGGGRGSGWVVEGGEVVWVVEGREVGGWWREGKWVGDGGRGNGWVVEGGEVGG